MRLVLVDNLIMPDARSLDCLDVHPHLGLLALAAMAERDGHDIQILDPKRLIRSGQLPYDETLYEQAARQILAMQPVAVGFTALGCSFLFAINVAALLKRCEPDLPILLGGPHATMLHREILQRFPQFDLIVRYEADEIIPAVLDCLEKRTFSFIPGLSWRTVPGGSTLRFNEGKPKVDDLDRLPIASYDYYPVAELGLSMLRIEAGRGCPFSCTFCSTAGFFQRSFRIKSAGRLVTELDILHERYGFEDFKLDHDMFTVNRRKVVEFCEAVSGKGYRWRVSARIDCVDQDLLKRMADAGCVNTYFGIETGSSRMQQIVRKRLDLGLVEPIIGTAAALGIETTASFITGYPEETEEDQNNTLDVLGQLAQIDSCLTQLHILEPEPGTPLYEQFGKRVTYDGYSGPYNARLLSDSDRSVVLDNANLFQTYYYYPGDFPRARFIFAVEAVSVLRSLGPSIFAYTICAFGGSLSRLIREWESFAGSGDESGSPTTGGLETFVARQFGSNHHILSLIRFALRQHATGGTEHLADKSVPPHDKLCVLADDLEFLDEMHDCGKLILTISSRRCLLTEEEVGATGSYVVQGRSDGQVNYWVDSGTASILRLFKSPRSCNAAAHLLAQVAGLNVVDPGVFDPLLRSGLLVSAPGENETNGEDSA